MTNQPKPTNENYTLTISAPLLRPGLSLTVGPFSDRYAVEVMAKALDKVREFNTAQAAPKE